MTDDQNQLQNMLELAKGVAQVSSTGIYKDALQPAVIEAGKTLHTGVKTINALIKPLEVLVWGWDTIWGHIQESLEKKLNKVPNEQLVSPNLVIAGPTFEALRYAGYEPSLRELYTNLLASSMDRNTASEAHPAFVEIIRQLTPDEAKLMQIFKSQNMHPVISVRGILKDGTGGGITVVRNFCLLGINAGCEIPDLTSNYLDNLSRLGLIQIHNDQYIMDLSSYNPLEEHDYIKGAKQYIEDADRFPEVRKGYIETTDLGKQFIRTCVQSKDN